MVPTTADRWSGSATNGVAQSRASAQPYRWPADVAVRSAHHARPPFASIQSTCSASSTRVAIAGVLSVWSARELCTAVVSERNSGTQRLASTRAARSTAAGDSTASHRPPSEANDFCGAK